MNIENHLTSFDLSMRLKELGVKQQSLFYWKKADTVPYIVGFNNNLADIVCESEASAWTVSELGLLLPEIIKWTVRSPFNDDDCRAVLVMGKVMGKYVVEYRGDNKMQFGLRGEKEAETRGEVLAMLLEKKQLVFL